MSELALARVFLAVSLCFTLAFNVAWSWGTGILSGVAAAACTLIVPAGLVLWRQVPAHSIPRRMLRAVVMGGVCAAAIITSFSHSVEVLLSAGWTDWTAWSVTGGAELLVALSTMAVHAPRSDSELGLGRGGGKTEQVAVPLSVQESVQLSVPRGGQSEQCPEQVAGQARELIAEQAVQVREQVAEQAREQVAEQAREQRVAAPEPRRTAPKRTGTRLAAVPDGRFADFPNWVRELGRIPTGGEVRTRYGCGYRKAEALLATLREQTEQDEPQDEPQDEQRDDKEEAS